VNHLPRTLAALLAGCAWLLLPALAAAADAPPPAASKSKADAGGYIGSFEFQAGTYRPDVDSEFTLNPGQIGPWQQVFGTKRPWIFKLRGARALYSGWGTVELGFTAGWFSANGQGYFADGTVSQEKTSFRMIPTSLDVTYRLDFLWDKYGIPVVPYGRASLDRFNWWVTGSGGSTSKTGATNGYSFAGGLAFVLDALDPTLAREIQRDSGIRHTMLFVETQWNKVNDFGHVDSAGLATSWNLSNDQQGLTFGFLFTF
jgi:hypothetical protein